LICICLLLQVRTLCTSSAVTVSVIIDEPVALR